MKLQNEKRYRPKMRFFTPELYRRFNSFDDDESDAANDEWEECLRAYQKHLQQFQEKMPSHMRKLAKLCLHDAELLKFERVSEPYRLYPLSEAYIAAFPMWSAVVIQSLRQGNDIITLIYALADEIRKFRVPRKNWPFSKNEKRWLYDEIDTYADGSQTFLHRILFSDGEVVELPFGSVLIHVVSVQRSD